MSDTAALRSAIQRRVDAQSLVVSSETVERCAVYLALLSRWNSRMNLTALPLDSPLPDRSIDKLIVEPLCAAEWMPEQGTHWLDLGSGGGSPAIPLRLAHPNGVLSMVEARARKSAFLREATRTLELPRTDVLACRFEELFFSEEIGLITSRAVRLDADLARLFVPWLTDGGRVLSFGGAWNGPSLRVVRRKALPGGSWLEELRPEV